MRVAFYLRVSTADQTTENQQRDLEAVAKQRGWDVVGTYDDNGVSGAKGREHRKQFNKLILDATSGKFDLIACWSVDRLGRSLQDLVGFLSEIHAVGVDLYLHKQGLDTSTPAGKALFQMLGVFSEFERAMIVERVKAGMARAKANGIHVGRPRLPDDVGSKVRTLATRGLSNRAIGREVGIAHASVGRLIDEQ